MYISPWLQSILLPKKWDVCGINVPPLSLWHGYILRSAGNPYVCGGEGSKDAAAELLMYASLSMDGGAKLYNLKYFRARRRKKIFRSIAKLTLEQVNSACYEYASECLRQPAHEYKHNKDNTVKNKPVSAPFEWCIVAYLCKGDMSQAEAIWNSPYSKAVCLFDAQRNVMGEDDTLASVATEERIDGKLAAQKEAE